MTSDLSLNLNSIGILVAIGAAVIGPIVVQTSNNTKFEILTSQLIESQKRQTEWNATLDSDRKAARASFEAQTRDFLGAITELGSSNKSTVAEIARLQEADKALATRQDRMGDAYNERFDQLRDAIGDLKTGQALTNQRQDEIKALLQSLLPGVSAKRGPTKWTPPKQQAGPFQPFKLGAK